jgi:hypothetical protein
MVGVKKTITTAMVALAVASVVHAGMVPVSPLDGGLRQSLSVCEGRARQHCGSNGPAAFFGTVGLDSLPVGFLLQTTAETGQRGETKSTPILTDGQNSLSLCLYALLGLGLCRAAPFVKKSYVGGMPEWYYTGKPYRIGHSIAVAPDCFISALAACFIQPAFPAEDSLVGYCRGIVVSLWRKSQFAQPVLTSRGPPPC